jgi:hypothetical protein
MTKDEALEKKAQNARELGLDYEPVAFASHGVVNWIADKQFQHEADLYSAPQRTWVGLTDEEIKAFDTWHDNREEEIGWVNPSEIVAYIEAKLKEKNT